MNAGTLLVIVVFVGAMLVFVPWLAFWAIVQLFGFHIDFTFWNWVAWWVLTILTSGARVSSK